MKSIARGLKRTVLQAVVEVVVVFVPRADCRAVVPPRAAPAAARRFKMVMVNPTVETRRIVPVACRSSLLPRVYGPPPNASRAAT